MTRVRTILALGNWVLGSICRYWVVLLLGDISVHCDTQYDTDQTAVSTIHMTTILTSVMWPLSADDSRESGVQCKLYSTSSSSIHHSFEILHCIVLYIFCFKINTLLCYTVVSVLVLGSGIIIGQYYWILGALFGIVLTLVMTISVANIPSKSDELTISQSPFLQSGHISCLHINRSGKPYRSPELSVMPWEIFQPHLNISGLQSEGGTRRQTDRQTDGVKCIM